MKGGGDYDIYNGKKGKIKLYTQSGFGGFRGDYLYKVNNSSIYKYISDIPQLTDSTGKPLTKLKDYPGAKSDTQKALNIPYVEGILREQAKILLDETSVVPKPPPGPPPERIQELNNNISKVVFSGISDNVGANTDTQLQYSALSILPKHKILISCHGSVSLPFKKILLSKKTGLITQTISGFYATSVKYVYFDRFVLLDNFFEKELFKKIVDEGYVITEDGLNSQERLRKDLRNATLKNNHALGSMTRLVIRGEQFYELNLQFDNSLDLHSEGGIQSGIFHRNGQQPYRRYVPEYTNSGFGPQFGIRELSRDAETPHFNCKLSEVLQHINTHFTKGEETQILLACCLVIPSQWRSSNSQLTPNTLRNMDRADLNKQRNLTIKYSPELSHVTKSNTRSLHYPKNFFNETYFIREWHELPYKDQKKLERMFSHYNNPASNKWNELKQNPQFQKMFALSHPYLKKSLITSSPNDFNENELNLLIKWNPNLHKGGKISTKKQISTKIISGKKRIIYKGSRGGKYYIKNKKKVYIK